MQSLWKNKRVLARENWDPEVLGTFVFPPSASAWIKLPYFGLRELAEIRCCSEFSTVATRT